MKIIDHDKRIFEGIAHVEARDKDGEIIKADDVLQQMYDYSDIGGAINDTHTNKAVGKLLNWMYEVVDGTPAIKIVGKIHDNYKLHDEIWQKMKDGVYKGLSIGAKGTKYPDGTVDVDDGVFEISVCESPRNPKALLTGISIAKGESGSPCEKDKDAACDTPGSEKEKIEKGDVMEEEKKEEVIEKQEPPTPAPVEEVKEEVAEEVTEEVTLQKVLEAVAELSAKVSALQEQVGSVPGVGAEKAEEEKKEEEPPAEPEEEKEEMAETVKKEVEKALKANIAKATTPNPSTKEEDVEVNKGGNTAADIAMGKCTL